MRLSSSLSSLLYLASLSTAWPSGWHPLEAAAQWDVAALDKRATTSFDLSFAASAQGNTATTEKSTKTKKNKNNKQTSAASISISSSPAKETDGGKKTTDSGQGNGKNGTTAKTKYETTKTFDNRLPAGGVSMITPAIISGAQYYKIADYVTFAWNFTSLSVTPSAVDILASCSTNSATYTIAMNQSISGATQAITWDTGAYQASATVPLLVATYTLIIYDADSSMSDTPRAGYLGVYDQFTFGMYTPQPYTPISDYVCATCNGAMSSMERQTLAFVFGTVAVTVLSFGWFAGVAGLW